MKITPLSKNSSNCNKPKEKKKDETHWMYLFNNQKMIFKDPKHGYFYLQVGESMHHAMIFLFFLLELFKSHTNCAPLKINLDMHASHCSNMKIFNFMGLHYMTF